MTISLKDIERALDRFDDQSVVRRTPVEMSRSLTDETGGRVYLKMEHLQRTGSFKTRGAYNKLKQVNRSGCEVTRVIAASAGNHAQGVALAATKTGLDSTIVMPKSAPQAKIDATSGYGADVRLHGQSFTEAMEEAKSLVNDGSIFVHAYDDPHIIAGQGTLGLEILEQVPGVSTVIVPIGGGGLISGLAMAIGELSPDTRIVGVQAEGAATVPQSLRKGEPQSRDDVQTIADGIATGGISNLTYDLIDEYVDEILTVTDTQIAKSILYLLERTKQMVEAAGATTVAAMRTDKLDVDGETVVPILTGGNLGLVDLQTVLTHGLTHRDQLIRLRVRIIDKPGELKRVSGIISDHEINVQKVIHERSAKELDVGEAYLVFRVETIGLDQTNRIVASLREAGYSVTRFPPE